MRTPWKLPALLGTVQAAAWPGLPLLGVGEADPARLAAGTAVLLVAFGALVLRNRAPVPVTLTLSACSYAALWLTPDGELSGVYVALLVAYFAAVVHRPPVRVLQLTAALLTVDAAGTMLDGGTVGLNAAEVAAGASLYVTVAVLGSLRRAWLQERAAAAARLAEAERRRSRAADDERRRLARELHDVTAHHLTSIVVTVSAAQRLADRRPELAAQALRFAADTGRETLAALRRLVTVMRSTAPDDEAAPVRRLTELVDGVRRLGQPVELVTPADGAAGLPPGTADAVLGVAREALTNALRHAPGSRVRVLLRTWTGGAALTVDDDGAAAPATAGGLGAGRGIAGMRERAAAAGGTLTAGPREPAGWRVQAVFGADPAEVSPAGALTGHSPAATASAGPGAVVRWRLAAGRLLRHVRSRPAGPRLTRHQGIDHLLVASSVAPAVIAGVAIVPDVAWYSDPVLLALAVLHGVPLYWRRRHPWTALTGVLAAAMVLAVLVLAGIVAPEAGIVFVMASQAELFAVYSVAATGRPRNTTWLAAPGTAAVLGAVAAATGYAFAPEDMNGATPAETFAVYVILSVLIAIVLATPMFGAWLLGFLPRRRRELTVTREAHAVASALFDAQVQAHGERMRISAGLGDTVLGRSAAMVAAADAGRLDGVLAEARAALGAMRGLLDGLDPAEAGRRDPQPEAASIAALCARHDVPLQVTGEVRPLPADVGLSAYRLVELALGGAGPDARVTVEHAADAVGVVVGGTRAGADATALAALRARVAAVGGALTTRPGGGFAAWLPTVPAPRGPNEEVAPSPSV